jgi:hypothetical protein
MYRVCSVKEETIATDEITIRKHRRGKITWTQKVG